MNSINKFILIYQCYEVLIDYVTRAELNEKVCTGVDYNGHKLKEIVYEISGEGYRLNKLLSKYSIYRKHSDFETSLSIEELFNKYKPELLDSSRKYSSIFYQFRNQIVHNLRMFYTGDESEVKDKEKKMMQIISNSEFMVIETITSLTLQI